jgi:hypothetical protein
MLKMLRVLRRFFSDFHYAFHLHSSICTHSAEQWFGHLELLGSGALLGSADIHALVVSLIPLVRQGDGRDRSRQDGGAGDYQQHVRNDHNRFRVWEGQFSRQIGPGAGSDDHHSDSWANPDWVAPRSLHNEHGPKLTLIEFDSAVEANEESRPEERLSLNGCGCS